MDIRPDQLGDCPPSFNLADYVLSAGQTRSDKIALSVVSADHVENWSYGRLIKAVGGIATGLRQSGLRSGDKVLMRMGNTVDFPLAYLGAITAGIIPIPTSAQLTQPEVAIILRDMRPAMILRDPLVSCPAADCQTISIHQMRMWHDLNQATFDYGDPNRLAYIVYTSGTSGSPHAVAHAHRAIWARQMMIRDWYEATPDDRFMHTGAFNWTYTLGTGVLDPWTIGATALIPAPDTDPLQLLELIKEHQATILASSPGVYRKLLKGMTQPIPHLRHALSAGEKLPEAIQQKWWDVTGTHIHEAFGMSECSTFVSSSPTRVAHNSAIGRPQRGRVVAIIGPDGPCPPETPGIIAVHRDDPGLMLGYLNAPNDTAERYKGDWFLTGDEGVMTTTGEIRYLGRADDMLNAGGFRVSPLEVEQALLKHPLISDVAVAEKQVRADVRVIAAYYLAQAPIPDSELESHCAANLARYKHPRVFLHLERLPRNSNGKILRRSLRNYT
jgi:acyl-coenzyme A synthetase/AMP-(fatty) acid ligase